MVASLFEHINRGAQSGDRFKIIRVDPEASMHGYTNGDFEVPDDWRVGEDVYLLDWQPQTLSPRGRCRFSINGKTWAGKAHALRLIVEPNGRLEQQPDYLR